MTLYAAQKVDRAEGGMVTQPAFGHRLRQLRRQRELSQADLAGPDLSASYVSLLESGQRNPAPEVVELFAERLGIPVTQLTGEAPRSQRHRYVADFLAVATAREDGEYDHAAQLLTALATRAEADGEDDEAWSACWELSEVLHQLQRTEERLSVLTDLVDRPLTRSAPELEVRVRTAMAEALRYLGRVGDSVRTARLAVTAAAGLHRAAPERVRALLSLVASLTEAGDMDAAEESAAQVLEVLDAVPSRQLRGSAYWSIGNVRFLTGRVEEGIAAHDAAFALLRPETDLWLWARLSKASAAMRLADGGDRSADNLAAARTLLARARSALDLVGTSADRAEQTSVEAQLRLAEGDLAGALELGGLVVAAPVELSAQDLAACVLVMARAHAGLGHVPEAARAYRTAAATLEDAGAYRSATAAWHELSDLLLAHPDAGPAGEVAR